MESFEYLLRVDNNVKDIFIEENTPQKRGTKATFLLSLASKKHLNDVFSKFAAKSGDVGFNKQKLRFVCIFRELFIFLVHKQEE